MSTILNPFQLLEINVISAQDLAPVSRSMRTYAVAWVHPDRKLSTRVDTHGHTNPTWNDKFVFRVDDAFLRADTSAIMIQIYAASWFRDVHVGTVRVLVGNLIPPPTHPNHLHHHQRSPLGMRFVALQVRRPSGRPQGILNIGVAVLDSSMRSMPLYSHLSASAVGFHDLMTVDNKEDPHTNFHQRNDHNNNNDTYKNNYNNDAYNNVYNYHQINVIGTDDRQPHAKAQKLMRSRSERSERVTDEEFHQKVGSIVNGSDVGVAPEKGKKGKKKKGRSLISDKASSLIIGSDVIGEVKISGVNRFDLVETQRNKKPGKAGSVIGSVISGSDVGFTPKQNKTNAEEPELEPGPILYLKPISKTDGHALGGLVNRGSRRATNKVEFAAQPKTTDLNGPYWADSEVGPSASEVAAAVMENPMNMAAEEDRTSAAEKWSLDESVEGLRSKLERWRTELPPLYDRGEFDSYPSSTAPGSCSGGGGSKRHARRHTDGGGGAPGLFSCFSNICGYECSCVCGRNATVLRKKGSSARFIS